MKVLFVCPFVPWPLENGGKIRTASLLESAGKLAEIDLCVIDDGTPRKTAEAACRERVASVDWFEREPAPLWKRLARPKLERWFHSPGLVARLARIKPGDYDLVHLDEMLLTRSLPKGLQVPVVLHHHKLDRILYERLSAGDGPKRHWDLWKLAQLERLSVARFPDQIFCSEEDSALFRRSHPSVRAHALPSGFDPRVFQPAPFSERQPERLVFLGSMNYGPNIDGAQWLVREVLPKLERELPNLQLELVGGNPTDAVRALESPRVTVTGRVPDVRPYLARAGAMLVPLSIGGGTRLKIVEALAMDTPTLATTIGAEGLGLIDGEHLRLADDATTFAERIVELVRDSRASDELGRRGGDYVRAHFRWEQLGTRLVEAWQSVL